MFTLTRSKHNPILSPVREHPWEAAAAFNGCPVVDGKKIRMVYRAMSEPDLLRDPHIRMSVVARAESDDGFHFDKRAVLISPDREFDFYGCEDPRVTRFEDKYYIFYTAIGGYPFGPDNIKVAVGISNDLRKLDEKHLVTPFNAKGMCMFPEKVNGKMAAILTINTDRKPSDICYVEFEKPEDLWSEEFWKKWQETPEAHKIHVRRLPSDHLELGAPPLKTSKGWLVVYSHIQKYGENNQVFGIEALLLDPKNPRNIVGRTKGPFMVPEDYYENLGMTAHVIFPSGALIRNDRLEIYYGGADTHCAVATIPLDNFLGSLASDERSPIKRFPGNPIISPRAGSMWESKGTFNPGAVLLDGKTHIFYRAVSADNISTFGYAETSDGFSVDERPGKPVYFPMNDFESRGCEDPRLQEIADRVYMSYTAYDGVTPRVAVTSISSADFRSHKWSNWSKPEMITPPNIANKDAAILPEPVKNGGYMILHRVHESVCADFVQTLDFRENKITQCIEIINPRRGMWDGGKVGLSTPPIKTKTGWLLFYHGVSWSTTYRIGAALLDLEDPTVVLARTAAPLFEPQEEYERKGAVPNVVFPCGLVLRKDLLYLYYGAADSVSAVATISLKSILKMLET